LTSLYAAEGLIFGTIMIFLGLSIIPISMKLARSQAKAYTYNRKPAQIYGHTNNSDDRKRNRPRKPTATAAVIISLLYITAGLTSIMIGPANHIGRLVISLVFGAIIMMTLLFLIIMMSHFIR